MSEPEDKVYRLDTKKEILAYLDTMVARETEEYDRALGQDDEHLPYFCSGRKSAFEQLAEEIREGRATIESG